MAQFNPVALVIAPQRQHHIGHHHHQCSALGNLLIQAEQHPQHGNRDQAAADSEQTTHSAQGRAQQQIHH